MQQKAFNERFSGDKKNDDSFSGTLIACYFISLIYSAWVRWQFRVRVDFDAIGSGKNENELQGFNETVEPWIFWTGGARPIATRFSVARSGSRDAAHLFYLHSIERRFFLNGFIRFHLVKARGRCHHWSRKCSVAGFSHWSIGVISLDSAHCGHQSVVTVSKIIRGPSSLDLRFHKDTIRFSAIKFPVFRPFSIIRSGPLWWRVLFFVRLSWLRSMITTLLSKGVGEETC